jgi:hypothetical protein
MKNNTDLSQLSLEELHKRAKTSRFATGLLLGVIILQFCIGIYLTIKKGFNVFTIIPMAFLPMVMINYAGLKKINEEIAKRKN